MQHQLLTGILTEKKLISDCRYRVIESTSLVPVLFREVFSHPYISFFLLLVNGFSVIYFRMITFYLLPMLAECGRGSISLQSPVTYQVETDQKRSFESVTPDLPLFLLTSSRKLFKPLLSSRTPCILPQFCNNSACCLVCQRRRDGSTLYF